MWRFVRTKIRHQKRNLHRVRTGIWPWHNGRLIKNSPVPVYYHFLIDWGAYQPKVTMACPGSAPTSETASLPMSGPRSGIDRALDPRCPDSQAKKIRPQPRKCPNLSGFWVRPPPGLSGVLLTPVESPQANHVIKLMIAPGGVADHWRWRMPNRFPRGRLVSVAD